MAQNGTKMFRIIEKRIVLATMFKSKSEAQHYIDKHLLGNNEETREFDIEEWEHIKVNKNCIRLWKWIVEIHYVRKKLQYLSK